MPETQEIAKRKPRSNYTDEEVELALRAVAVASGNVRRAEKMLEAQGRRISYSTLQRWKTEHADRYATIQEEILPAVRADLAESFEDFVHNAAAVEAELLARIAGTMDELPPRDLSTSMRNVSVAKGISAQHALAYRGLPTQTRVTMDITELLKGLTNRFAGVVSAKPVDAQAAVDGHASELPNAHDDSTKPSS